LGNLAELAGGNRCTNLRSHLSHLNLGRSQLGLPGCGVSLLLQCSLTHGVRVLLPPVGVAQLGLELVRAPRILHRIIEESTQLLVGLQEAVRPAVPGRQLFGAEILRVGRVPVPRLAAALDSLNSTSTHEGVLVVAGSEGHDLHGPTWAGSVNHLAPAQVDAYVVRTLDAGVG